jgi:glycosyltransferase involved in cell wall biosynthesis
VGRVRILFVSGTSIGGAARSTHQLAAAMRERGHDVVVLLAADEARIRRTIDERLLDASVRWRRLAPLLGPVRRAVGSPRRSQAATPYATWHAPVPEHHVAALLRAGADVAVVSSVERPAWREIRAVLRARRIPAVLYLRERPSIGHLVGSADPADLVLANSYGHAREAAEYGVEATVIPSMIDADSCRVHSTREVVVFVNPVPLFGLDTALALADARPDIPFVFVRSWPIEPADLAALERDVSARPNVSLQDFSSDPRDVYRQARVVLAPYRHPGRPRVAAEAQLNGIPVLGSREEGLVEAIGDGGLTVANDAPVAEWVAALGSLWDDTAMYERACRAAREHAERDEMRPEIVAARFEQALIDLFSRRP